MHNSAKSGLFLIEMIIAICFFALSAAVCTSLFVRAHLVSEETRQLNMAVLKAQSVVESFKAADGTVAGVADVFDLDSTAPSYHEDAGAGFGGFTLYFDKSWQQTTGENYAYTVDVSIDETASPRYTVVNVIAVASDGKEALLYSLEAKTYIPA